MNSLMSNVEFRDDMLLQAIDDANCAIDDADTEARYAVDASEIIERWRETATELDDRIFKRAFHMADKQAMTQVITMISDAFEEVVREKRNVILAKKND